MIICQCTNIPIAYIAILFHWHIGTSLLFYLVQHLQCRLDSSLRLVCIETTCFKVHSCIIPTNDSLHKGIGPSAGWYRNGIISQHRERTAQIGIYLPQGTNESIVLSLSSRWQPVSVPVPKTANSSEYGCAGPPSYRDGAHR